MSEERFVSGDVVATPDGRGVVVATMTEEFEFPQAGDEDEYADVSASDDDPVYIVGLESGGSAPYRGSTLYPTDFDEESPSTPAGTAEANIVDGDVSGLRTLPEGWAHRSILEYWASIGGSWEACVDEMMDEFGEERAREHCSAMKDEVLQTTRWRNRF